MTPPRNKSYQLASRRFCERHLRRAHRLQDGHVDAEKALVRRSHGDARDDGTEYLKRVIVRLYCLTAIWLRITPS